MENRADHHARDEANTRGVVLAGLHLRRVRRHHARHGDGREEARGTFRVRDPPGLRRVHVRGTARVRPHHEGLRRALTPRRQDRHQADITQRISGHRDGRVPPRLRRPVRGVHLRRGVHQTTADDGEEPADDGGDAGRTEERARVPLRHRRARSPAWRPSDLPDQSTA